MEAYVLGKQIGQGSYGTVHLVTTRASGQRYVLKQIPLATLSAKETAAAHQEVQLMAQLRHPFLVELVEGFVTQDTLCVVMQYCEAGDLGHAIGEARHPFPEDTVVTWLAQLAMGLDCMHSRHTLHRDVKTQNIFLTRTGRVQLGDLGIAKQLTATMDVAKTTIGTPMYMSPEILQGEQYGYKTDIWSLGCVLVELMTRKPAFRAQDMGSLIAKVVCGKAPELPAAIYSQRLVNLAQRMLSKSPYKRPSAADILQMPFVLRKAVTSVADLYSPEELGDSAHAVVAQFAQLGVDIQKKIAELKGVVEVPRVQSEQLHKEVAELRVFLRHQYQQQAELDHLQRVQGRFAARAPANGAAMRQPRGLQTPRGAAGALVAAAKLRSASAPKDDAAHRANRPGDRGPPLPRRGSANLRVEGRSHTPVPRAVSKKPALPAMRPPLDLSPYAARPRPLAVVEKDLNARRDQMKKGVKVRQRQELAQWKAAVEVSDPADWRAQLRERERQWKEEEERVRQELARLRQRQRPESPRAGHRDARPPPASRPKGLGVARAPVPPQQPPPAENGRPLPLAASPPPASRPNPVPVDSPPPDVPAPDPVPATRPPAPQVPRPPPLSESSRKPRSGPPVDLGRLEADIREKEFAVSALRQQIGLRLSHLDSHHRLPNGPADPADLDVLIEEVAHEVQAELSSSSASSDGESPAEAWRAESSTGPDPGSDGEAELPPSSPESSPRPAALLDSSGSASVSAGAGTGCLGARAEDIRTQCLQQLGPETFQQAYAFLTQRARTLSMDEDEAALHRSLLAIFGDEATLPLWRRIDELVFIEQSLC